MKASEYRKGSAPGGFLAAFEIYARRYLRRHFRSIQLNGSAPDFSASRGPYVVFLNHPSWWDPLVCLVVARHFARPLRHAAVIDSAALERYPIFRRLGFFGVEKDGFRGARALLRMAAEHLSSPARVLWLTPQAEFVDQRVRPVKLRPGLSHLAARHPRATFIPLALDYSFGPARLPSVHLRFGRPFQPRLPAPGDTSTLNAELCSALQSAMDKLAQEVVSGVPEGSLELLSGQRGTGGIYGWWERVREVARNVQLHTRVPGNSRP
jgi:1-acyl-sn-glycerol-3-phosphate acyltransferase